MEVAHRTPREMGVRARAEEGWQKGAKVYPKKEEGEEEEKEK